MEFSRKNVRREPWNQEIKADIYVDENMPDQRNAERWVATNITAEVQVRASAALNNVEYWQKTSFFLLFLSSLVEAVGTESIHTFFLCWSLVSK